MPNCLLFTNTQPLASFLNPCTTTRKSRVYWYSHDEREVILTCRGLEDCSAGWLQKLLTCRDWKTARPAGYSSCWPAGTGGLLGRQATTAVDMQGLEDCSAGRLQLLLTCRYWKTARPAGLIVAADMQGTGVLLGLQTGSAVPIPSAGIHTLIIYHSKDNFPSHLISRTYETLGLLTTNLFTFVCFCLRVFAIDFAPSNDNYWQDVWDQSYTFFCTVPDDDDCTKRRRMAMAICYFRPIITDWGSAWTGIQSLLFHTSYSVRFHCMIH